jgi:hypothetical protein
MAPLISLSLTVSFLCVYKAVGGRGRLYVQQKKGDTVYCILPFKSCAFRACAYEASAFNLNKKYGHRWGGQRAHSTVNLCGFPVFLIIKTAEHQSVC